MVLDTILNKHPGQAEMLALANLVWYPHIRSEIVSQAQGCRHCIETCKNIKPFIPRKDLGSLPPLSEPNEEVQMNFAGPILFKNNVQSHYILVTVDRLSRYPHAETYNNCNKKTAIEYLDIYCKVQGITRSIRCDQAQAFKAREFKIFCKNKNLKMILAPTGDHRGTGMVDPLIQTIKRRLAVSEVDTNWSSTFLSERLANNMENIRLIPNSEKNTTPFEAHFDREPNTLISNIVTKPFNKNLSYKKLINNCLDKKLLKKDVLSNEEFWRRDGLSEDNLDIQYKDSELEATYTMDSDESDNLPLRNRPSRNTTPLRTHFTLRDRTTKYILNKRNITCKSIAPRTLPHTYTTMEHKSKWNNHKIHTSNKAIDTHLKKNTAIRKNNLAVVTESKHLIISTIPCKIANKYIHNQKIKGKLCLEEERNKQTSNIDHSPKTTSTCKWSHE